MNWSHALEGGNLLGVGLNASLGDDVSQQLASWHAEDTFFGVQLHPISPLAAKRDAEVVNQVVRLPGFHVYIVYVCLDGSPDVIPENVLHTSLVCSARISETERHCHVAIHPERRD
jgi:hypothetical protein